MNLDHFIDIFGDDDESNDKILQWFGSYDRFFNICYKSGKFDQLSDQIDHYTEPIYNNWVLNNADLETKRKIIDKYANQYSDIKKEGDQYIWSGDRLELADLFCVSSRRDYSSYDVAMSVLKDDFETWNDHWTDDVMNNVYDELNTENQNYVKQIVKDEILGKTINAETEFLEDLQNEEGEVLVTEQNVYDILNNYETLSYIIENETDEIKSELKRILNYAEESALYDEVYNDVFSELKEYFDIEKKQWKTYPSPFKKDKTIEKFEMPINKFVVWNAIEGYIEENDRYNDTSPDYHGTFIGLLNSLMDTNNNYECLKVSYPEYPDWTYTKNNLNRMLKEYL
jgi:hypothetical protein